MSIVFLDFEASSLFKGSYPIEVGWIFSDGNSESYLIKPAENWSNWSSRSELIHGISREMLLAEGLPHTVVAERMAEALVDHKIYTTAPSWDGKWLSVLFKAANLPRRGLKLMDVKVAQADAAKRALSTSICHSDLDGVVADVIARIAEDRARDRVTHRALDDARQERLRWLSVTGIATEMAARLSK